MIEFNLDTHIIDLREDLGTRIVSCLINDNITDVRTLLSCTRAELLRIPNFGRVSLNELVAYLYAKGGYVLGTMEKPKPAPNPENFFFWYRASENKPEHGNTVIFISGRQYFVGKYCPQIGWYTPLPHNTHQNWDTLIKITSNVTRWSYLPFPEDGDFY